MAEMTALNGMHNARDMGLEVLKHSVHNMTTPMKRRSMQRELAAIPLLAMLDRDDRPTFAIEVLSDNTRCHGALDVIYHNAALLAVDGLLAKVSGQDDVKSVFTEVSGAQLAFLDWLHDKADEGDPQRRGNAYVFEGHTWSAIFVEHYKIVSGMPTVLLWTNAIPGGQVDPSRQKALKAPARQLYKPSLLETTAGNAVFVTPRAFSVENHGPFDCTQDELPPHTANDMHIAYFRNVDWAATPLGPMASWTTELRGITNLTLSTGYPAVLLWGDDLNMIYNQQYTQLIGTLHPCMGKSIRTMAPEHWPAFEPLIDHINRTGHYLVECDMPLVIDRHGFREETNWSFQFVPVLDSNGNIAGFYHTFFETTHHNLLKRQVSTLVEVGSQTANARDFQSFWDIASHTLTLNPKDVPFALLYATEGGIRADMSSVSSPGSMHALERIHLKGSIGVVADHPVAPSILDVGNESYIFHPFLLQAAKSRKATIVHLADLPTSESTMQGIDWKGYGDPCRTIVVCPILPTNGEQVEGFLILGISKYTFTDYA